VSDGSLVSTIPSPNGQSSDYFGYELSLHGNKLAVGQGYYNDANGNVDAGLVYVFG
jgi:hypothetical protein